MKAEQQKDIETIVNTTLAPAETILNWTDSDKKDFVRDVERLAQLVAPENRQNARDIMITKLAFHFTTPMRPTEEDSNEFKDIATTFVDEIIRKLPPPREVSSYNTAGRPVR